MKKQKICIIGGGLTGLITAISLSKLNCSIDLITGNDMQNLKSNRTIAVSENNFDFLNKLNISESLKKEVWTCSIMKLYTEIKNEKFSKIFEIDKEKENKKIFYMIQNSKLINTMINKIKKTQNINMGYFIQYINYFIISKFVHESPSILKCCAIKPRI